MVDRLGLVCVGLITLVHEGDIIRWGTVFDVESIVSVWKLYLPASFAQ